MFDVVVVGVVQRSPVELWHVLVPKPELPRWQRHNSNKLWLKLVPKRASRDAVSDTNRPRENYSMTRSEIGI